jgi:recombination protein RecA
MAKENAEKEAPKTNRSLKTVISDLNEKFGDITAAGSEALEVDIPRLSTGVFVLDFATGGGIPMWRFSEVYGMKSSGKTTMSLRVCAEAQRTCRNCYHSLVTCKCGKREPMRVVYVDVEGKLDEAWAIRLGVDMDKNHPNPCYISKPDSAEQTGNIVEEFIKSTAVDVLVVDSLAAMMPFDEGQQAMEKQYQGLAARILNKAIRKWTSAFNHSWTTNRRSPAVILLNQIRHKVGVIWGDPTVTPGGFGHRFATGIELRMWGGKVEYDDDSKTGLKFPLATTMGFEVKTSSLTTPYMQGEYKMVLANTQTKKIGDIFDEDRVFAIAMRYAIITRSEGNLLFDGAPYSPEGTPFRSEGSVVDYWMSHPEEYARVKKALLEKVRLK